MQILYRCCCGLDVHAGTVVACLIKGCVAGIASQVIILLQMGHHSPGIILVNQNRPAFKWRHFEPSIILLCVRWYCRNQLSYSDLEEMMRERGLTLDHTTVWRWVQIYQASITELVGNVPSDTENDDCAVEMATMKQSG